MKDELPRRQALTLPALLAAATTVTATAAQAQAAALTLLQAREIARDAYLFGYPLVTVDLTRRVSTNRARPEGFHAPMNQFAMLREYPDASFNAVTAPNADTLYSSAFMDLGAEPWVITWPDMGSRYYLMPMLDGWTNVIAVAGARTTGGAAQTYVLKGPKYNGPLPAGVPVISSPTDTLWILGRIYCTGTPEDYAAVHAIQDQIKLVPLSSYNRPFTPPAGRVDPSVDMTTAVRAQVDRMSGEDYFKRLAELMMTNPPVAADAPILARMARIGIVPGRPFDPTRLPATVKTAIAAAPRAAAAVVEASLRDLEAKGRRLNNWSILLETGIYGTNYAQRATVTVVGLGANRPQDAVYPLTALDSEGRKLNGANRYVLRIPPGMLPPARGFWSLTMYNAAYFFVANPLNRYTLSERNALKTNADGSLDLYIQAEDPGPERQSNWLPAPTADFVLMFRLYWPKDLPAFSILNQSWIPPAVVRAT
ncbi:DUF1254 domain-containing protein [Humitalea sp. 24SJ18S-53]|uniref:DUF1254 domain-containing protein n=1 Tax=Humitalea sp. 24SJ18S-53 TaxID=3422307 RepID=UPI003D6650F2